MKFTIPYCYPLARGIRANDVNSLVADGPGFTVYLTVGRRYEECRRLEAAVPCASSCLVGKGRVIRPSPLWFNANLVIDGKSQLLLAAEVMLRRLDRHVTE